MQASFPTRSILAAAILVSLAAPTARAADVFQITNRTSDLDPTAFAAVIEQFNTLADNLESEVNTLLSTDARTSLASGFASANAGVTTALAGDHANSPSLLSVGAGLQGSVFVGADGFAMAGSNELPEIGVGLQTAVTVGFTPSLFGLQKLGPIDGKRLSIYLSGLSFTQSLQGFDLNMANFGVKGQYQIVAPRGASFLLKWEGVSFGTGVLYSSNSASYGANVAFEQSGATETLSVDLDYNLGISSSVTTIPLELSTAGKLLGLITVFGGVGADLSFGGSTLIGGAEGPISASSTAPGVGSLEAFSGNAVLDLETDDGFVAAPFLQSRVFFGTQFDLWVLKLGIEAVLNGTGSYGGAANLRVVL